MKTMKKIAVLLALSALLAGCVSMVQVDGEQVINNRMSVQLTEAWNKLSVPGTVQPFEVWTQEGMSLDNLRFWAAIRSGQELMVVRPSSVPIGTKPPRMPTYTAGMPPDQLVALFETLYSLDGSIVKTTKVEPTVFAGEKGIRFEFSCMRKADGVQLSGIGWFSVRNNELFAATFVAPKLSFFDRIKPKAESVVRSARIKG